MTTESLKEQFARATAEAFARTYPEVHRALGSEGPFDPEDVLKGIEKPRDARMGRFAFPIFRYVSQFKTNPAEITRRIADETNRLILASDPLSPLRSTASGPYLNGTIDATTQARSTISEVLAQGRHFADSSEGAGLTDLIEYSAPNIAKPFGVGHLRSTVIGNSLRRIFRKLGYTVVGINYPGDWGTQFGKMIVAFRKWGSDETLKGNVVRNLLDLYVRFHKEADHDDSLNQAARDAFRQLEENEPEARRLWETFKAISHAEFDRVYGILGVEFDLVYGESFLNDKMEPLIDRLSRAGLTSISQGALVVDLKDPQLPPALLKKGDGATLYITRDIAGMVYRWERYQFNESMYVVGVSQSDHFKQALKVVAMLEEAEQVPEHQRMTGRMVHVDFGWVKFGDKVMHTREGNIVLLEDVIDQAVALAKVKIREKNPDLPRIDDTAGMIGIGAVLFSQLSVRRNKDVNFDWDDVLNFEGETGPYLQYTHARLCSLERNFGRPVGEAVDFSLLTQEEEQRVIEQLDDFRVAIHEAARNHDPVHVASYLLRLSGAFNKFYQRKDASGRIDKIISDNESLSAARMALVKSVRIVLSEGLYLLGLQAPEEM